MADDTSHWSVRRAVPAHVVDGGIARPSDPRRVPWGVDVMLSGRPPAIVLFAPHKTGSTFFTRFLHDLSELLGLCWYTDNAAFMYRSPHAHSKCASPSCGHAGAQRQFTSADRGWGDCTPFADSHLRAASTCASGRVVTSAGDTATHAGVDGRANSMRQDGVPEEQAIAVPCSGRQRLSAANGVAWGALRLPEQMRTAVRLLGEPPWHWYMVLHARHPGDTLVSGYHSFGWTHPAAPLASAMQRRAHATRQASVRNLTLDQYVASNAAELARKYLPYSELLARTGTPGGRAPAHTTIISSRYEEMVTAFPRWLSSFMAHLSPSYSNQTLQSVHAELLRRHARAFVADGRHKRSVAPGRFASDVSTVTANEQRRLHREWWQRLGY